MTIFQMLIPACLRPRTQQPVVTLTEAEAAKLPIVLRNVRDQFPPRAVMDCVDLLPMPRLTSANMKQGMVLRLLRDAALDCEHLEYIGSGQSAVVYDATRTDIMFFKYLLQLLQSCIVSSVAVHQPVVLKCSIVCNAQDYDHAVRENTIHRYMSKCSAFANGFHISTSANVPLFFFAGYMSGWYITVMQNIQPCVSLQHHLSCNQLSATNFVAIEQLLYQMWCLSVVHADVHLRNLMWHPLLQRPMLVDFGNAMFLPQSMVMRLRAEFHPTNDAISVWFAQLSAYARAIIGSRDLTGFRPDGIMLRYLLQQVQDPENIASARKRLRYTKCHGV